MEHVRGPSPAANSKATSSVDDEPISLVVILLWEENDIEHIIILTIRIIDHYRVPMTCLPIAIYRCATGSGLRSILRIDIS
jgi:hypothetical protein